MGFIQFKRGPSDKLEKVLKAPGEPILLTDIDELLVYKDHPIKPLRFKPFKKYLELERIDKDFTIEDGFEGRIWLDYTGEIKFGTIYNGILKIIPISSLVNRENFDKHIKTYATKNQYGHVKIGANLEINNGVLSFNKNKYNNEVISLILALS